MRRFVVPLLVLACFGLLGTRAWAEEGEKRFSVYGSMAYGAYAMEQVNRSIDFFRSENPELDLPRIAQGYSIGGGAEYAVTEQWLLGFEVNVLNASSRGSFDYQDASTGKVIVDFLYSLPALETGPMVRYAEPIGANVWITAGIGLDYLYVFGDVKTTVTNYQTGTEVQDHKRVGPGLGFKYMVGGEVLLHPALSLGLEGGIRLAKVFKVRDEHNDEVPDFEVDYSGLFLQGSVKLHY